MPPFFIMNIKQRKKILFCSEASFANTGFGNIYRELISRLHNMGKFRVAEFATNVYVDDPRTENITWRLYPNSVTKDDPRSSSYNDNTLNKYGLWRFNDACLDFEPDIVIDLRDPPMFQHEYYSVLRPYYYWCIGPTVDSAPQPADWIEMFLNADAVMPYTEFGESTLKEEHSQINVVGGLGPGINLQDFRPLDKDAIRDKFGLHKDAKILGYVSRNQSRKLFPALLKDFKAYIDKYNDTDTYLYLHTAYPDSNPWNISKLLIETGLYNRVLFTYYCTNCKGCFANVWQGSGCACRYCEHHTAMHPRTTVGCSTEQMCEIYNLFDYYVQYSNCEGLGVGVLEAAACGVPFMAIDYSAMSSLNKNLGGLPIPYVLTREIGLEAERAIPCSEEAIELFHQELSKPKGLLRSQGAKTRILCDEKYNWDNIAAKWADFLEDKKPQYKWGQNIPEPLTVIKNNSNADQLAQAFKDAGRSDLIGTFYFDQLFEKLKINKLGLPYLGLKVSEVEERLTGFAHDKSKYKRIVLGKDIMAAEDFINYADLKEVIGIE